MVGHHALHDSHATRCRDAGPLTTQTQMYGVRGRLDAPVDPSSIYLSIYLSVRTCCSNSSNSSSSCVATGQMGVGVGVGGGAACRAGAPPARRRSRPASPCPRPRSSLRAWRPTSRAGWSPERRRFCGSNVEAKVRCDGRAVGVQDRSDLPRTSGGRRGIGLPRAVARAAAATDAGGSYRGARAPGWVGGKQVSKCVSE
eukprot:scaffold31951_cov40-Phaeocystis_antarctica.AAC.2